MKKLIFFLFLALSIWACSSTTEKGSTHSSTSSSAKPISGSRIYTQLCTQCHGAKGDLELNGATNFKKSELSLEERIDVITNGRKTMLPYKGQLNAAKIKAVAKYTMELKK